MPDFPPAGDVPRINTRSFNIDFLCVGGDHGFSSLDQIAAAVSGLELANLRTALGNMSNGVIVSTAQTESVVVNQAAAEVAPLDEAFSSVGTRAVMVFQNDDLDTRSVSVPAPDASLFESDGVTLNRTNGLVNAAIIAALAVINGGAAGTGTYAYLRGYRQEVSRKLPKGRTSKAPIEPGAGVNPPDAPGA